MSNLVVSVETQAGSFTATAKQGPREHSAVSDSPQMAARIAAANLLGVFMADVAAIEMAPGVWSCVPRHGALVQEAAK